MLVSQHMIQMDISGHPPIPLAQNNCPLWQFPSYFSMVFWVPNFRSRFEALNIIFLASNGIENMSLFWTRSLPFFHVNRGYIFPTSYRAPKLEIVCKIYDPGKLYVQLATLGPQTL